MKKIAVILVLIALLATPTLGIAASPWFDEPTYNEKVSGKFQFGLLNTLLGWTDLFIEPIRGANHCTECSNFWTGLGKGFMDAIVNTVGGAAHLITFPLVVDFPLPDNGVQFTACCGPCGTK